jgi:hypothetical protein
MLSRPPSRRRNRCRPKKARPDARSVPGQALCDPQYVAAARELRDLYIEQINAPGSGLLLPPSACGKYDVSRALEQAPTNFVGGRGVMKNGHGPGARLLDAA